MLKFYDVDLAYTNYLQQFEKRIPNITYNMNNKFVCGIMFSINNYNYFAPISSKTNKQKTNVLIQDNNGVILSSIKFCFMFPAPDSVINIKNFKKIRLSNPNYAELLEKEFEFCRKNEQAIRNKAMSIYKIGCNPNHILHKHCCNFPLLEIKYNEWIAMKKELA